ncbi:MAG TPA: VOC family protein [Thermoleophilaceae bacterium]|nr:VOC family protein [Thermoleophilaceae bacterium]
MLDSISHVAVWVHDQDVAKEFYTEKLGFEVREDNTLPGFDNYRWLTVSPPGQPDVRVILSSPGPPAVDAESAKLLLELAARGALGPGIIRTDDCRKTCAELEARGVELSQQPDERFYGIDAAFRDPSGNEWRIVQPLEYDIDAVKEQQGDRA